MVEQTAAKAPICYGCATATLDDHFVVDLAECVVTVVLDACSAQGDAASVTGWLPVFRTEVKFNNLNPAWQPIVLRSTVLNNGDPHRPLLLKASALIKCCSWQVQFLVISCQCCCCTADMSISDSDSFQCCPNH
jgi:hypothetical protein